MKENDKNTHRKHSPGNPQGNRTVYVLFARLLQLSQAGFRKCSCIGTVAQVTDWGSRAG